jgi:hypothetical protein
MSAWTSVRNVQDEQTAEYRDLESNDEILRRDDQKDKHFEGPGADLLQFADRVPVHPRGSEKNAGYRVTIEGWKREGIERRKRSGSELKHGERAGSMDGDGTSWTGRR